MPHSAQLMCTLIILRNRVAGWPLVLGANRDEYRDRPWEAPRRDGDVVAPRDLRAGGTWLALADSGLLVAVTNRPEEDPDPDRPSRGTLALKLARCGDVATARDHLLAELGGRRRNAFQVLLASATDAVVGVHPGDGEAPCDLVSVPDGLHTLTNLTGLDGLDHRGALNPLDLPEGTPFPPARALLEQALRTHGDKGPRGVEQICKHGEDRGTLSSAIIALPAIGNAHEPLFWFAPGVPCKTFYSQVTLR